MKCIAQRSAPCPFAKSYAEHPDRDTLGKDSTFSSAVPQSDEIGVAQTLQCDARAVSVESYIRVQLTDFA